MAGTSKRRGTDDEIARARALIAGARAASGLSWDAFARTLGQKGGGNLQQFVERNPERSGGRALIFAAFTLDLAPDDRRLLVRLSGMEGLIEAARNSRAVRPDVTPEDAAAAASELSTRMGSDIFKRARMLEDAAFDADFDGDWECAYVYLLAAEKVYTHANANAAHMVVRAAEELLKLGDYVGVDGLMARLEGEYFRRKGPLGPVRDPFTWASAELLLAQVALHRGRFADALGHADNALVVGDYGSVRLDDAWHLRGRAYAGLAQYCRVQARQLGSLSLWSFRVAIELHRKANAESALGYDHLHVAYANGGVGREIAIAREMLGGRLGSFHVRIFDASHDPSPRRRREAAEEALGVTTRLRYRRGIARAMRLRASMDARRRTRSERLESAPGFAAAYLAYPLDGSPQAAATLEDLDAVLTEAGNGMGAEESRRWVDQFEDDMRNHVGPFGVLSGMRGDTAAAEEALMGRVRGRLLSGRSGRQDFEVASRECPRSPQDILDARRIHELIARLGEGLNSFSSCSVKGVQIRAGGMPSPRSISAISSSSKVIGASQPS
jgi:hypothetical protein